MIDWLIGRSIDRFNDWLSEWVLLSSKRAIFQVYYYENELLFDELGHHERKNIYDVKARNIACQNQI
jgi:hypothetical protein